MTGVGAARSGRPRVIAHRGASRDRPENTLAAFDEALRQGCDGIELDVQLSREGVPVVYHDRTLRKAGGGGRRVHRLDLSELRELDAGAWLDRRFRGQHIPSLEEVLDRYGRRTRLLIEIKAREGTSGRERHRELARAVARLVSRKRLLSRVMVLSFDREVLSACAEAVPRLARVLNLRPPRRLAASLRRELETLSALSVDVRSLTPAFAGAVARSATPLFVYTCNTPSQASRATLAGATALMSDRPGWLGKWLDRERG